MLNLLRERKVCADDFRFAAHGLKINVTKSEHIVIGHPRTKKIFVDSREEAKKVKLLGITFDNHYKFDSHVDNITGKIATRNGQLMNLLDRFP